MAGSERDSALPAREVVLFVKHRRKRNRKERVALVSCPYWFLQICTISCCEYRSLTRRCGQPP